MSMEVSRRGFLKAAGATAAGVAIASGYSPFSYASNEKVRVASIGTGGQGSYHLREGLSLADQIDVVAVCDVYKPHLEGGWRVAGGEDRDIAQYIDYRRMLDEVECDAVVISTPLDSHYRIAMDCLDAGKYVFLEKTMCMTYDENRELVKKCHETGLFCQIGHQRRYNPEYNKALWLAEEQRMLGRINHITAQWHRNNDWRRPVDPNYELSPEESEFITDLEKHINWRLYNDRSGGLVTELTTHQLDVATWFLGSPPARVCAFGGVDYWRDGREAEDNIVLIYEWDVRPGDLGFHALTPRNNLQSLAQLNRPYKVRMTYSSITANAMRGASELIQGDTGTLELTEGGCYMYGEPATQAVMETRTAEETAEAVTMGETLGIPTEAYEDGYPIEILYYQEDDPRTHDLPVQKSPNQLQMEAFAKDIVNGTKPKANEIVGLYTAIPGIAGIESMHKGGVTIDIDPALYSFDFETPDPYRYDYWIGPEHFNEDYQAMGES